jgi:glycogen operon protein
VDTDLLVVSRRLIRLRREQPVFRRRDFLVGSDERSGLPDVVWLRSDGVELTGDDWKREDWRALEVFLNGDEIPSHSRRGAPIRGDSFLLAINGHHDGVAFSMPDARYGARWILELATDGQEARALDPGEQLILPAYALAVLRREQGHSA